MIFCWWCGYQGTWSSQPAPLQPRRWEWGRARARSSFSCSPRSSPLSWSHWGIGCCPGTTQPGLWPPPYRLPSIFIHFLNSFVIINSLCHIYFVLVSLYFVKHNFSFIKIMIILFDCILKFECSFCFRQLALPKLLTCCASKLASSCRAICSLLLAINIYDLTLFLSHYSVITFTQSNITVT